MRKPTARPRGEEHLEEHSEAYLAEIRRKYAEPSTFDAAINELAERMAREMVKGK